MSEKRFQKTRIVDKWGGIYDSETDKVLDVNDVEHKLNEQQATIQQLQAKLREKEEDERLYANEILELRETNKEHIKFKSLGGDY